MDSGTAFDLDSESQPTFRIDAPRPYLRAGEGLRPFDPRKASVMKRRTLDRSVAVPVRLLTKERDTLKLESTLFLSID